MKTELFIASRLKLGNSNTEKSSNPSLNIAVAGMVLAMVIMILSLTIVCGFKKEITNKIYQLDSHIKITNAAVPYISDDIFTVDYDEISPVIQNNLSSLKNISSVSLIAEKPSILKTSSDFKGVVYKGVDENFDWSYINSCLVTGRIPSSKDASAINEILISDKISKELGLKVDDKILTYFIDKSVKVRNSKIVGIFKTDFDEYDKTYILGNIAQIQSVNGWTASKGTYVGVNLSNLNNINNESYKLYTLLSNAVYDKGLSTLYNVTNTTRNNLSYFAWLDLLDMNVIIILILMAFVSAFTLISGLLMIILERINMIGVLKTFGATNYSIRKIFIYLTHKLIFKSIIWGNIIGIGLTLLQKYFHIIKLDAEAYYIPYVPVDLNWTSIILLNIGVLIISYITLIFPSMIISSIKPSKTIRFE